MAVYTALGEGWAVAKRLVEVPGEKTSEDARDVAMHIAKLLG